MNIHLTDLFLKMVFELYAPNSGNLKTTFQYPNLDLENKTDIELLIYIYLYIYIYIYKRQFH